MGQKHVPTYLCYILTKILEGKHPNYEGWDVSCGHDGHGRVCRRVPESAGGCRNVPECA